MGETDGSRPAPSYTGLAPLDFEERIKLPAGREGVQLRIVGDRGPDILVTEQLGDCSERSGAVLLHHPSGKVPELMRGHLDADPICEHSPDLLRKSVCAFVCRTDREQVKIA